MTGRISSSLSWGQKYDEISLVPSLNEDISISLKCTFACGANLVSVFIIERL